MRKQKFVHLMLLLLWAALDVEAIKDAPNAQVVQSIFIAPAHTLKY